MQCILYHDEAGRQIFKLEPSLSSYHVFSWSNIITTFPKRNLPSKNCTQIKQYQIQNIFRPAVLIKIKESTKCLVNVVFVSFVSLIWSTTFWSTGFLDIAGSLLLCTSRRPLGDCGDGGVGWVEQAWGWGRGTGKRLSHLLSSIRLLHVLPEMFAF